MALNLSRNTKVYFTTNVDATTGVIPDTATFTATNTYEIPVQDGYSFSQGTEQQTITLAEAGNTPNRGQRAFNTQLNPVEWSFSTYIRPQAVSTFVTATEKLLWNALLGSVALDDTGTAITGLSRANTSSATVTMISALTAAKGDLLNINGATPNSWNQAGIVTAIPSANTYVLALTKAPLVAAGLTATLTSAKAYKGQWAKGPSGAGTSSYVTTMGSNKNQLQKFGLIFVVDTAVYFVHNCAMDQVSVDFGLDQISMCAWTGKGTGILKATTTTPASIKTAAQAADGTANYITNKLSTLSLGSNIGAGQHTTAVTVPYSIPITGGNITIANNISYLTPTNLNVVNKPIGYYTGQRSITGNVTAYLRTGGTDDSGKLLENLLVAAATTTEPKYALQLEMGGASNSVRVEFDISGALIQIPTVDIADVVSTTINFTAQGFNPDVVTNQEYDITIDNDLVVRYYSS